MKLFYLFLGICLVAIIPILRAVEYWHSALYFLNIFFIIWLLVLTERIVTNQNVKIANAILLGFSFCSLMAIPKADIDHFIPVVDLSASTGSMVIHIPDFIEKIFSIPETVLLWFPASGILGSMISLAIMLLIQFIRKKKSQRLHKQEISS